MGENKFKRYNFDREVNFTSFENNHKLDFKIYKQHEKFKNKIFS